MRRFHSFPGEEALAAELRIKNWSRTKKQALARSAFDDLNQAAKQKDWAAYRQRRQRQPVTRRLW